MPAVSGEVEEFFLICARQVPADEAGQEAIATWCGGRVRGMALSPASRCVQFDSFFETEVEASPGDWIVSMGRRFFAMPNADFFSVEALP